MLERIGFVLVQWKACRGLSGPGPSMPEAQKLKALQTGMRGETYAYWYLRRLGYIFVAPNYMPQHAKGELDLIGRRRLTRVRRSPRDERKFALPELSITQGKRNPDSYRAVLPSRAPNHISLAF
jgi:hypothetical protein